MVHVTALVTDDLDLFGDIEQVAMRRLDGWTGLRFAMVGTHSARRLLGRPVPGGAESLTGAAVDLDWSTAIARAHGEFRERLAASTAPRSVSHQSEVDANSPLAISELLAGSGSAILARAAEHAGSDKYDWVEGWALDSGSSVWLPAQATYLGHRESNPMTLSYWHWTSNGLAAGTSVDSAAMSGALELVERDRFMYHWCTRQPTTSVSPLCIDGATIAGSSLVEQVRPWRVRLGRMDTSGLPVEAAICLLVNPVQRPAFAMGASAGVGDFAAVAAKAFFEAVHSVLWGRQLDSLHQDMALVTALDASPGPTSNAGTGHDGSSKGGPADFAERVRLYSDPARLDDVTWLVPEDESQWVPPPVEQGNESAGEALRRLVDALAAKNCRLFAHHLAVPADRFTGITTVRVLSPDLQPLSQCHQCELIKPDRLGHGPYNPDPHPFP